MVVKGEDMPDYMFGSLAQKKFWSKLNAADKAGRAKEADDTIHISRPVSWSGKKATIILYGGHHHFMSSSTSTVSDLRGGVAVGEVIYSECSESSECCVPGELR